MSLEVRPDGNRLSDVLGLRDDELKGRIALVTDTARGIGRHTASMFAALGATVIMVDISPDGASLEREIREKGGAAYFIEADIGDLQAVERLVASVHAEFGRIDILINNAAQLTLGPVLELPASNWNANYATNVVGPVKLIQSIVPGMIERGLGVIISLISLEGMPFMGPYCATKMALRSMMLSLGKEIPASSGVSVLSVMPGAVDTPLAQGMIRSFSELLGIEEEKVRDSMSNNPGYAGLVPVEHVAASLAWFSANAAQFHGQFVHGYLPMSQAGLIDIGDDRPNVFEVEASPSALPNPERELKHLIEVNRSLENRIQERTRELEAANAKLQEAILIDPLTGLWNRRYVDAAIIAEVGGSTRGKATKSTSLHLLMIDIDHFKQINDTYGHMFGDAVLKDMARLLKAHTRESDKVLRWGGEEFLVVLKAMEREEFEGLVESLRRVVAEHPFAQETGSPISCTCSLGFTSLPNVDSGGHLSWLSMVSLADLCMYAAKKGGRNRWAGVEIGATSAGEIFSPRAGADVAAKAELGQWKVFGSDSATRAALLETPLPTLSAS